MNSPELQGIMIDIAVVTANISNVMRSEDLDLEILDRIIEAMETVVTQLYKVQIVLQAPSF